MAVRTMAAFVVFCSLLCLAVAPHSGGSTTRVLGGQPVGSTAAPIVWQAFLTIAQDRACGAALLSSTMVLTAAHCVRDLSFIPARTFAPSAISVCTGTSHINCVQRVPGRRMWIHPSYVQVAGQNPSPVNTTDVAVIELVAPLTLGGSVGAIPLASPSCASCEAVGAAYLVSGYGKEKVNIFDSSLSNDLNWIRQDFVSRSACQSSTPFLLPSASICAGAINVTGASCCQGDSGGPMAYFEPVSKQWVLMGIVSTGTNVQNGQLVCGTVGSSGQQTYDVFVSVMRSYAWITSAMGGRLTDVNVDGYGGNLNAVVWYYWVPPMAGGMVAILFLIYILWDRRRKKAMAVARVAGRTSLAADAVPDPTIVAPQNSDPSVSLVQSAETSITLPMSALAAQYGSLSPTPQTP